MPRKRKPTEAELAEQTRKAANRERALDDMRGKFSGAIDASKDTPRVPPRPAVAVAPSAGENGVFSDEPVGFDDAPPVLEPKKPERAVKLPPKRSDGWGKPVVIDVKEIS